MSRLVVFCLFIVMLAGVFTLGKYSKLPVNNEKFSMAKAEKAHLDHIAKMKELDEMQKPKVKVVAEEVEEKPLVVLDTPELERGSKLYGKCIVCHGKRGEGKKSQNAPKVGGQHAWYLTQQLIAMKNKTRVNKVMDPYIKKLTEQDFKDLSAYMSKLPW